MDLCSVHRCTAHLNNSRAKLCLDVYDRALAAVASSKILQWIATAHGHDPIITLEQEREPT